MYNMPSSSPSAYAVLPDKGPLEDPFQAILRGAGEAENAGGGGLQLDTSIITADDPHQFITLGCTKCGHTHRIKLPCGDRLCLDCAKQRQMKYRTYLVKKFANGSIDASKTKLLTLTVRSMSDLGQMVDMLFRSFRRLRQRQIWKRIFVKGVYSLEVAKGKNGWHAHFHILGEMAYWNKHNLSKVWNEVTKGRGKIIDIRVLRGSSHNAIREICKYPFKPHNLQKWTDRDRTDYNFAVKGRRLFSTLGEWYADKLEHRDVFRCPECGGEFIVVEYSGLTVEEWNFQFDRPPD